MQIGGEPIRVRLEVDLTRYDNRCKKGALGWTKPNSKFSPFGVQDRFIAIEFDSGAKLDVLFNGLKKLKSSTKAKKHNKGNT